MTAPLFAGQPIARLPFQVRPNRGEGGRSFITRLAHANHLPPAYLRKCLTEPPHHRGVPAWDRIAAVTGRDPIQLRRILETIACAECGTAIRPRSSFGVKPRTCSTARRQKKYRRGVVIKTVPCRICAKPMRIQLGQRRFLCSSPCRRTAYLRRKQPSTSADTEAGSELQPGQCVICERPLPPRSPSTRRTCSAACRNRASRWAREAQRGPAGHSERKCGQCGTAFQSNQPNRRWCSNACRQRATRERRPPSTPGPTTVSISITACRRCESPFPSAKRSPCPWCSVRCWEAELADRSQQEVCGACGESLKGRKPEETRRWCSSACRQRAARSRAELRERKTADQQRSIFTGTAR